MWPFLWDTKKRRRRERHEMSAIADALTALGSKVDAAAARVADIKTQLTALQAQVTSLTAQVNASAQVAADDAAAVATVATIGQKVDAIS